jgi:CubicO group peptidase (beta-lactamase class C family)
VIEMLFGPGRPDVAGYAADLPLAHPVDSTFCYSSGTSCIVSAATRRVVGDPSAYEAFMRRTLFDPIGMRSPVPKFDAGGTATAEDQPGRAQGLGPQPARQGNRHRVLLRMLVQLPVERTGVRSHRPKR